MKGGRFGLSLPWPDLALGGFRIVSKKWTDQCEDCSLKNKTGTSKVGAISKAQKARLFLKKNEIFDFFSFRKCRIVPKNVKEWTLWALLTYILLQNIKKLKRGTF